MNSVTATPSSTTRPLIIAISQSGETADTLAAIKEARARGAKVVAVCNAVGSSLTREADGVLYTQAGPEIGVASTKAYVAQLCVLYLLGLRLGALSGKLSPEQGRQVTRELRRVPALYEEILKGKRQAARVARKNSHFGCFLFLGRNNNFPSALEGALKLKEISYIPAEGYPAGEMKHGPIALIDEYRAVVCLAPQAATYDKMISNMQEIRARKGRIIAVATAGDKGIRRMPRTSSLSRPLTRTSARSWWSCRCSCWRIISRCSWAATWISPRNLAKSVTVE